MISLAVDAVTALVVLADRGLSAVEKNVRLRASPRPVETHPLPGADCAASAGPREHTEREEEQ